MWGISQQALTTVVIKANKKIDTVTEKSIFVLEKRIFVAEKLCVRKSFLEEGDNILPRGAQEPVV